MNTVTNSPFSSYASVDTDDNVKEREPLEARTSTQPENSTVYSSFQEDNESRSETEDRYHQTFDHTDVPNGSLMSDGSKTEEQKENDLLYHPTRDETDIRFETRTTDETDSDHLTRDETDTRIETRRVIDETDSDHLTRDENDTRVETKAIEETDSEANLTRDENDTRVETKAIEETDSETSRDESDTRVETKAIEETDSEANLTRDESDTCVETKAIDETNLETRNRFDNLPDETDRFDDQITSSTLTESAEINARYPGEPSQLKTHNDTVPSDEPIILGYERNSASDDGLIRDDELKLDDRANRDEFKIPDDSSNDEPLILGHEKTSLHNEDLTRYEDLEREARIHSESKNYDDPVIREEPTIPELPKLPEFDANRTDRDSLTRYEDLERHDRDDDTLSRYNEERDSLKEIYHDVLRETHADDATIMTKQNTHDETFSRDDIDTSASHNSPYFGREPEEGREIASIPPREDKPENDDNSADSEDNLSSSGTLLRQAREQQKLSVKYIAERLYLDIHVIKALEADDYEILPPIIFVRGYLRNYAKMVDISPTLVMRAFEQQQQPSSVKTPSLTPPSKPKKQASSRDLWPKIGSVVVVLTLMILVAVWQFSNNPISPTQTIVETPPIVPRSPETQPQIPEPPESPVNGRNGDEIENGTSLNNDNPMPEPPINLIKPNNVADPISPPESTAQTMHVHFKERAWVKITDKTGKQLYQGIGNAGERLPLEGTQPFYLKVGNIDGVNVEYNGEIKDIKTYPRQRRSRRTFIVGNEAEGN
jgi:cytoskeleton protein RodZ